MNIKKPTRSEHSDTDCYLDEENAEIGDDIISEDQLQAEEEYTDGEIGIPDDDEECE